MRKLPLTPFHIVLDLSITNDPAEVAGHFDRFFEVESKRFEIGAAYTEMNGFDINPDRWYCDLFAYPLDGGRDNYDWISEWESERFADCTITGLELLQQVYASDAFHAKEDRTASYVSSLMVVIKFQKLMQSAATYMRKLRFPLYVTAHDFDFIAAFDLRPESSRVAVRKISAEEKTSEFIGKLHDEDSRTRFRAAAKLYSMGPAAKWAVGALMERLDDPDLATRQMAVSALAEIDPVSEAVVSALIAGLQPDQPAQVRQEIVRALGKSPTKKATVALANVLFDDDPMIRRYSAISLKMRGAEAKEAAPALRRLLETETDREIRSQAEVALARMDA